MTPSESTIKIIVVTGAPTPETNFFDTKNAFVYFLATDLVETPRMLPLGGLEIFIGEECFAPFGFGTVW